MKGYPRRFAGMLYLALLLILVSGIALVPTFLDMRLQLDVPWRPDFSQRTWIAMLHTGTGLLVVWLLGALWSVHMRAGWRRHRNRFSGVLLVSLLLVLIVTSLGIFYAGDEDLSLWSSLIHLCVGLALPMLAAVHAVLGRRLRQHRHRQARPRAAPMARVDEAA